MCMNGTGILSLTAEHVNPWACCHGSKDMCGRPCHRHVSRDWPRSSETWETERYANIFGVRRGHASRTASTTDGGGFPTCTRGNENMKRFRVKLSLGCACRCQRYEAASNSRIFHRPPISAAASQKEQRVRPLYRAPHGPISVLRFREEGSG